MLILLQKLFALFGKEDLFKQQVVQLVANYAETLYDTYGKTELLKFLNPILENVELKLVDTQTYNRMISE